MHKKLYHLLIIKKINCWKLLWYKRIKMLQHVLLLLNDQLWCGNNKDYYLGFIPYLAYFKKHFVLIVSLLPHGLLWNSITLTLNIPFLNLFFKVKPYTTS